MFKILVIDDDMAVQLLLKRMLEKEGYEVVAVSNGKDGIEKAITCQPAMIICDWVMPGLTGIDVCRYIKNVPDLSTTFFILLTSLDSIADRVKGLDAGADDFIAKPIEKNELRARVRAGLRLHQLSRDLQNQKRLLEAELAEAADYVLSLLPAPMTSPLNIDFRFIPSRQLGGDCFDYYWLDSEYLAIYLLDTAGHGLRATLLAVSVLNLLRSRALKGLNYYQPSEVLTALNETFPMNYQNDKYFTIWYGVYHLSQQKLIYASAGHPPAILVSENGNSLAVHQLRTPGMPIGMFSGAKYTDAICKVEKDSSLYIFSDGAYEITKSDGNIWGLDAFIQTLVAVSKDSNCQLEQIIKFLINYNLQSSFEDDLSILRMQFS
ncbi:MAG: SpoIIE family protein phosphatase [Calothrix sp. MO_192.B10]|nr:SpoIIE family protein phosphatase [Calothrix sp. MO_192.B10]